MRVVIITCGSAMSCREFAFWFKKAEELIQKNRWHCPKIERFDYIDEFLQTVEDGTFRFLDKMPIAIVENTSLP